MLRKIRKAFSLIEMTVVLVVLAGIISLSIGAFGSILDESHKKSAKVVMDAAYNCLHSIDLEEDGRINVYIDGLMVYKNTEDLFFYVAKVENGVIQDNIYTVKESLDSNSDVTYFDGFNQIIEGEILPEGYYECNLVKDLTSKYPNYTFDNSVAYYKIIR